MEAFVTLAVAHLQATKPYHTLFYDQNLAAMKARDEEEAAKQLEMRAATAPAGKAGLENKSTDMEMEDVDEEEEYPDEEDGVNNGDFDEEEEDI